MRFPFNLLLLLCVWVCQRANGCLAKWHANSCANGKCINGLLSLSLTLTHYADRGQRERAYSCWSIAKRIDIINMHGVQWSGLSRLGYIIAAITRIVILSTQNGRRHVRWTKHRRCLTFKCRLPFAVCHCSQLTVRIEQRATSSAAGSWRPAIKISETGNKSAR